MGTVPWQQECLNRLGSSMSDTWLEVYNAAAYSMDSNRIKCGLVLTPAINTMISSN
jgi:hypothetical protein